MVSKILINQTAFVGDALLTIPLINNLKVLYPDACIELLCRKGIGEFFLHFNLVDKVYEFKKQKPNNWSQVTSEILASEYDLYISPHQSFRSQWLSLKVKAKRKIGYKKWWNQFVFDDAVERPLKFPEVIRQYALLAPLSRDHQMAFDDLIFNNEYLSELSTDDVDFSRVKPIRASLSMKMSASLLNADKVKSVTAEFSDFKNIVFMAPGSVWPTKKWTQTHYAELGSRLNELGYKVVLIGSPDERSLCEEVSAVVPGSINKAGAYKLHEMIYVLKQGQLIFCNDSGAMHLAAVAGLPTISFFGPTTLGIGYRPWNDKAMVLQRPLKCRPCGLHGGKKCPIGTHECMKSIKPQDAIEAAEATYF